jgi:hypothetical protein
VAGDDPLLALSLGHNLDHAREDDVEVIAGVTLPVQILASCDRPAYAEPLQRS